MRWPAHIYLCSLGAETSKNDPRTSHKGLEKSGQDHWARPRLWPSTNSFLTPSAASADPVNPPFVTLTIWTNKELFGPHERFRTEHTQKSWYKHITISHPDIPHTIHTTLFSCPKRTNLPHPLPTHSTDSANLDEPTTFCPRERLRIKPTQKSWRRNTSRFSIPAHIYLCSLGAGMR